MFYVEYPEIAAMMIHEVYYGIYIGLLDIVIDPFGPSEFPFRYQIGDLFVQYDSAEQVQIRLPTLETHSKNWTVTHVSSSTSFRITDSRGNSVMETSDANGLLQFIFPHSVGVTVLIRTV